MRKFLLCIFLVLINIKVYSAPFTLEVTIYNPKIVYLKGEPIWVECSFTNTSSDTIWIEKPLMAESGGSIKFIVTNQSGDRVPPGYTMNVSREPLFMPMPIAQKGNEYEEWKAKTMKRVKYIYKDIGFWKECCIAIPPGEKFTFFQEEIISDNLTGVFHLKSIIYESLCSGSKLGYPISPDYLPFWQGRIKVPIDFTFNVKEPQGEEREVLRMLQKLYKGSLSKVVENCLQIVSQYPNSVYSSKAQDRAIAFLKKLASSEKVSQERIQKEIENLIRLYPDSPYALSYKNNKICVQR